MTKTYRRKEDINWEGKLGEPCGASNLVRITTLEGILKHYKLSYKHNLNTTMFIDNYIKVEVFSNSKAIVYVYFGLFTINCISVYERYKYNGR